MEMGFERNAVLGAMRTLQSNDRSALVPFLLDNPYLSGMDVEVTEEATPLETIESSSRPQELIATSSTTDAIAEIFRPPQFTEENLNRLKVEGDQQLQTMLTGGIDAIYNVIEAGILLDYGILDHDVATNTNGLTSESYIVLILNLSFRLFEDFAVPESVVRLIEVTRLFQRINALLSNEQLIESRLNNPVGGDLIPWFLKFDTQVRSVLETLISSINKLLQQEEDRPSIALCVPAMLLVDLLIQFSVVDLPEIRAGLQRH